MKCRFCWGGTERLLYRSKKPHQIWVKLLGEIGRALRSATSPHGQMVAFCLSPGTVAEVRFWGAWKENSRGQGGLGMDTKV